MPAGGRPAGSVALGGMPLGGEPWGTGAGVAGKSMDCMMAGNLFIADFAAGRFIDRCTEVQRLIPSLAQHVWIGVRVGRYQRGPVIEGTRRLHAACKDQSSDHGDDHQCDAHGRWKDVEHPPEPEAIPLTSRSIDATRAPR